MLKVQVHAADKGGCGFYRLIWPGRALGSQSSRVEVEVIEYDNPKARLQTMMMDTKTGPHVYSLMQPPDCDVIVLQRPLSQILVETIPFLQKQGIAVVVELDDDFEAMHPNHTAFLRTRPRWNPDHNWTWLKKACQQADMVTVSTPALARKFGAHGRCRLIPNYLPDMWFRLPRREPNALPVTGWAGLVTAHPNDLKQVGTAVKDAVNDGLTEVACVGTGASVARDFGVEEVRASGWVPLQDYPRALQAFDVGVVPLDLTPFNQAKSALKGLEFAAAGVPFVASPTEAYAELRREYGLGILASRAEWQKRLRRLLTDPDYREMRAEHGRETVAQHFRMADHLELWEEAWLAAADNAVSRAAKILAGYR